MIYLAKIQGVGAILLLFSYIAGDAVTTGSHSIREVATLSMPSFPAKSRGSDHR
jgi:hypothetical protein